MKKIYFIGIGGISMSTLAVFLAVKGNVVSGSDLAISENLKILDNFGITYNVGHEEQNIKSFNPNLVVTNCAISEENEEYRWAKANKKKIVTRSEILGKIAKDFRNVIAISGTHGKTTTTALVSEIFVEAGLKPSVHIGGILKRTQSNFLIGEKRFFITEACEYKNSFLSLSPTVGAVLNVEEDHLDFFKDLSDIKSSFNKFLEQSKIQIFPKDEFVYILKKNGTETTYCAQNIRKNEKGYVFSFMENNNLIASIQTNFIGIHNVKNTLVACVIAKLYKIKPAIYKKAIRNFYGVKRRFETVTKIGKTTVIHDYAHHPTEIRKTIEEAKAFGKVLTVFQPHTFSRTKTLFSDFETCFDLSDGLFLIKTYPAREKEIKSASAEALYEKIKEKNMFNLTKYFDDFESAKKEIIEQASSYDCVLILGAGDICDLAYCLK